MASLNILTFSLITSVALTSAPLPAQIPDLTASGAGAAMAGHESVSIARTAHGLTVDDGVLVGGGGDYKVVFDRGGVQFTPALGDAVEVNQNLRLTLESVRRGGTTVFEPREVPQPDVSRIDDSIAQYVHGKIIERHEVRCDALKQSFIFDEQPAGEGDLIVRLHVDTNMAADPGQRLQELKLRAGDLEAVHIGAVVGIDATGRQVGGHMNYSGSHLELVLPSRFVTTASYPLVLDPPINSVVLHSRQRSLHHHPDVAYEPNVDRYLVVWERVFSATDEDILGHFVSPDGNALGTLIFIADSTNRQRYPTVCAVSQSGKFVVAYEYTVPIFSSPYHSIAGRTVDAASGALGPIANLTPSRFSSIDKFPCLGGDSSGQDNECVLVYESESSDTVESREVTVSTSGALTEITSRRRSLGPCSTSLRDYTARAKISKDAGVGGVFAIAWQRVGYVGAETSLSVCLMSRNSTLLSAVAGILGTRMRNPQVSGDGQSFVLLWERAASSGPKQDIWGARLAIPPSPTGAPIVAASKLMVPNPNLDTTKPAVGLYGDRCLIGLSYERSAPLGTGVASGEVSATTLIQCNGFWGNGSSEPYSYNDENAIAMRVPTASGALDGLIVFRKSIVVSGSVQGSDIRVFRHRGAITQASHADTGACPAAPHAFGGPNLSVSPVPRIGTTITVAATQLAGTPFCGLLLGNPTPPIPLSVIGSTVPGSALCVNPAVSLACPATHSGAVWLQLPIPDEPTICGTTLDMQWIDYEGTGMNFGTSAAWRLTVGV